MSRPSELASDVERGHDPLKALGILYASEAELKAFLSDPSTVEV